MLIALDFRKSDVHAVQPVLKRPDTLLDNLALTHQFGGVLLEPLAFGDNSSNIRFSRGNQLRDRRLGKWWLRYFRR
jgi:hypothetical protein